VGHEEAAFAHKFVELLESWDGPPINLAIFHPRDESFTKSTNIVNLDDKYDIEPSLETSDALHQVILQEIGIHHDLSNRMISSLWENLWRMSRYSMSEIALNHAILKIALTIRDVADKIVHESHQAEWTRLALKWLEHSNTRRWLKRIFQIQLSKIPLHVPPPTKERL
jgi:hypothetical protein